MKLSEAFKAWLPRAYRQPTTHYTEANMEAAFLAGAEAAVRAEREECSICKGAGFTTESTGEKITCDCVHECEEVRKLVEKAVVEHCNGSDLWLTTSLAAREIYALYPHPQQASAMLALTDAMRAVIRNENDIYGTEDELYAALCGAAGKKASATVPDDVAKDAERYRWMRSNWTTMYSVATDTTLKLTLGGEPWAGFGPDVIDSAIDSAMLSATRHETPT